MKHTIYISNSIYEVKIDETIGEIEKFSELWKLVDPILKTRGYHQDPYVRYLMDPNATFIDFGSYSKFIACVPPFTMEEINAE